MTTTKAFLFLYPIQPYFDFEIRHRQADFRQKYSDLLNLCIDRRYRQKNFTINYALFDDCQVADIIKLQPNDKIIKVGLDFSQENTNRTNLYPDADSIIDQLGQITTLRLAGFHMWDCVDRLAETAYDKKLDVLVDEDLTEFFSQRLGDTNFKIATYPSYRPPKHIFGDFINARQNKPWLHQDY